MTPKKTSGGPVPLEEARRAQDHAARLLKAIPEVNGFGIAREGEGFVLKVNLAAPTDAVPAVIDGVPLRTEVVGPLTKR